MENEIIKNFLEKCRVDIQNVKQEIKESIDNLDNKYLFLCYKMTFYEEVMDMFRANRGGLGYFIKIYEDKEYPLNEIFGDYLANFTERKVITETGLYRLIDKKQGEM